jgi:M6 family metalloprotease-like protein
VHTVALRFSVACRYILAFTVIASLVCQNITPAIAAEYLDLAPVSASGTPYTNASEIIVLGEVRLLVIAVEFSDYEHTYATGEVAKNTIDQLSAYYRTVSYGAASVVGKVTDWIRLPSKMASYGADNGPFIDSPSGSIMPDTWKLLRDAAPMVTEDITAYNAIFILHAGPGQESSGQPNDIWSVAYLAYNVETSYGMFSKFAVVPEFEARGFGTLGVYAHEFGHLLGLPDLYDRTNEKVGPWDLMARGAWLGNSPGTEPAELTAWSRLELKWLQPEYVCEVDSTASEQQTFDIRAIELNPTYDACSAVQIWITSEEYYLVEARAHIGFDSHLPQEGILITFVKNSQLRSVVDARPSTNSLNDAAWQTGAIFHLEEKMQAEGGETGSSQGGRKLNLYIAVVSHMGNTYTVTVSFLGPPLVFTTLGIAVQG